MKSYEDMAKDIFKRRDEYVEKKRKTRRMIFGSVTPVVCCCLVAVMGIGILQKADSPTPPLQTEESMTTEDTSEEGEETDIKDNKDILWADTKNICVGFGYGCAEKHGVTFYMELDKIFDELDDDQPIAVCVSAGASLQQEENKEYKEAFEKVFDDNYDEYMLYKDKEHRYIYETLGVMFNQGLSWTEIVKSKQGIDYFYELFEAEYGIKNLYRLEAEALVERHLKAREELEALGFNVLYDGSDIEWGMYFLSLRLDQSCVVLTTPRQIKEFGKNTPRPYYMYRFTLAPQDPVIAFKHNAFDYIYRHLPSGGYIEGYNGNVDEFYKMVLEERKNKQG